MDVVVVIHRVTETIFWFHIYASYFAAMMLGKHSEVFDIFIER